MNHISAKCVPNSAFISPIYYLYIIKIKSLFLSFDPPPPFGIFPQFCGIFNLECFPNDQKLREYLVNKTHTVCVWVIHHTLVKSPLESLSWRPGARGRGSPEPSPILLSGGYLLTYADTASQFSLELKLKPKSFCQAQPQLNFNPIEAGIVLFSFNTATQPLSFFAPFWVNYKHISIIIIRNI